MLKLNGVLAVLLVCCLGSTGFCAEKGLICYLKFDEVKGNLVEDSSGQGNDGIIEGNPKLVEGKQGKALELYEMKDEVFIDNAPVFTPSDDWSVSFWAKLDPTQTDFQGVIALGGYGSSWGIYASHVSVKEAEAGKKGRAFLYTHEKRTGAAKEYKSFFSKAFIPYPKWRHYNLTKKGSVYTWYIDGVLSTVQDKGEGDVTKNTANVWIIGFDYSKRFKGAIDELRVYNRALTDQEIENLYKQREQLI